MTILMQGVNHLAEGRKGIAHVGLSGNDYNTALTMPSVIANPPEIDTDTGLLMIPCGTNNLVKIMFSGSDNADETFTYQVISGAPLDFKQEGGRGYIGEKIGEGVVTLGATTLGAAGAFIEASTSLWADTITETGSNTLSRAVSPGNDEIASLLIDVSQYHYIYVQVSRNGKTAATMNVIYQLHTVAGGGASGSLEILDFGLATSALQTTGNTAVEALQFLTRGKNTAASGQALNCVVNATNYTLTVVDGGVYEIAAHNGRIYLGEADSTSAANRIKTVSASGTVIYTAQSTTLHYSTDSGADILGNLWRVTMT